MKLIQKILDFEFWMYYFMSLQNPNYAFSPNTLTYLLYYYGNR